MNTQDRMAADGAITVTRFPIRLLTIALVLTAVAFAWFGWLVFDARRDATLLTSRIARIERLRGIVVHLDEVLTMSARMAATTGDARWEERYRHFEPQLDAAIKETMSLGVRSSGINAASRTNAANIKLVEMENRAFALVRAGRQEEARAALFSPEYETQKQIYAEGISSVADQISLEFASSVRDDQRTDLLALLAAMVVGGTSSVAWLSVIRSLRRWRAQLEQAVSERKEAEQALRGAHDELEVRIEERTAELGKTNQALESEIAERKRSEEALRESEERFRRYFELGLIGMAITSPAKGWIEVNDQLCQILGYERSELLQRTWAELTHPADLAADLAAFSRVLAGEVDGYSMNKRFIRKDGRVIDTTISAKCLRRADGSVDYFLLLLEDITERRRLEAQLLESQKMETVGKLAGGVAHEFNSIMTAIIGQSELLLNDLPPGTALRKNATEIRMVAERAASLTRQLLAYGRKQVLQPEVFDLNSVLAGMESSLRLVVGRGAAVRIVPAAGLKAVKADVRQIEQVIMNLAMNAADAMLDAGTLTLQTANVTLEQEDVTRGPELKAGEYVMLAITDTGAGMGEEVKARVFEPFFSTKGVGRGKGLGLSTCYGIIKQSGGHISVQSEPGRGTTFNIYLPQVEQQTTSPGQRLGSADLPGGTEVILLVEEDPALRDIAATLLRRLGYTVQAAANGIGVLSLSELRGIGDIDLLFVDVVTPDTGVDELCERVRRLWPSARMLVTSTCGENAVVQRGMSNKGVTLLEKPFTPSALAHKLREVLDQPGTQTPDTARAS